MVNFREHIAIYKTQGVPPTKDINNNWIGGTEGEEIQTPCRYDRNIEAKIVQNSDGKDIIFKGTIFIDKEFDLIPTGVDVIIKEGNTQLVNSTVIQSIPGHLKSHIIYI